MDNPEAAEAALAINPRIVMSMHRWNTNPEEFKKAVEAKSSQIKVVLLQPGEVFQLELSPIIVEEPTEIDETRTKDELEC
jgi:L-ascorbate metabolism protein UlaG (beta-lactamase superfamily)